MKLLRVASIFSTKIPMLRKLLQSSVAVARSPHHSPTPAHQRKQASKEANRKNNMQQIHNIETSFSNKHHHQGILPIGMSS